MNLFSRFPSKAATRRSARPQARAPRRTLGVEALEPRCVPAGFTTGPGPVDVLFFAANDGTNGVELWRSEGTPASTFMVKNINTNVGLGSNPTNLTRFGERLAFVADEGGGGRELWISGGTAAGTRRVKNINVTAIGAGSHPEHLTVVNGMLFFSADDGINGRELWKSDGTEAGTVMVKDINPGSGSSLLAAGNVNTQLINVNGALFFTAFQPGTGRELWRSDGTVNGTTLVNDIKPGALGSAPQYLTNANGTLFFRADDGINGYELWKSDGTQNGTRSVKDILQGSLSSLPDGLTNVNGTLFFSASDGIDGRELWKSDGTSMGTRIVKDIRPGSASGIAHSSNPWELTNVNGTLFFTAVGPGASNALCGRELWKSDGTPAGTTLVKDIHPGRNFGLVGDPEPRRLTNVNGTLFFEADDSVSGKELWKSDGTLNGTTRVKDINPGALNSQPQYLTNFNGTLFFSAGGPDPNTGANDGGELWKSDGTEAGTTQVKDIRLGSGSSSPSWLTVVRFHLQLPGPGPVPPRGTLSTLSQVTAFRSVTDSGDDVSVGDPGANPLKGRVVPDRVTDVQLGGDAVNLLIDGTAGRDADQTVLPSPRAEGTAGRSPADRMNRLRAADVGPRLNGNLLLTTGPSGTVQDDGGADWFFARVPLALPADILDATGESVEQL